MNFRELVVELESRDELLRIGPEVSSEYELPALLAQAESRNRACRFDAVRDADYPVAGGIMTTRSRLALGLGLSAGSFDAPHALEGYVEQAVSAPLQPIVRPDGPVHETVAAGSDVDLTRLPVPRFFSGDSHRFITAALGFALDPDTGVQNVGFYRLPLIDDRRVSVSAGPTSDLRRIYDLHRERGSSLQLAVAIGVPPALQIAAAADLPSGVAEVDVAGALRREPLELVRCRTSELEVPADSEFVIEMTVDLEDWLDNTMGEYGDQYGKTSSPVATVDSVSCRSDALFHVIMAGMGREHNQLGSLMAWRLRRSLLEALRENFAAIADVRVDMMPRRSGMRGQIAVAIDKQSDDTPGRIIEAVYAMRFGRFPLSMLMQRIVVVDSDVDILDHQDVEWAIASRVIHADQIRAVEDRTGRGATVTRLGIDATAPAALREALRRPEIPGAERIDLDDYLAGD